MVRGEGYRGITLDFLGDNPRAAMSKVEGMVYCGYDKVHMEFVFAPVPTTYEHEKLIDAIRDELEAVGG